MIAYTFRELGNDLLDLPVAALIVPLLILGTTFVWAWTYYFARRR